MESLAACAGVGAFSEQQICKGGEPAKKQYRNMTQVAAFYP
jgi:hypothetical protein